MKSDAQRDRVLHVVIERTSLRRTLNVPNTCATCGEKGHNRFPLCTNANASASPPRVSSFDDNGNIVSHNIVTTNGYTSNDIQDGTRMFVLGHNRGKCSDKFSAVEIIVDHIYLMPLPLSPSDTLSEFDNHDHHRRVWNFDSYSNFRQEGATYLDQPRLILCQLSCFLL